MIIKVGSLLIIIIYRLGPYVVYRPILFLLGLDLITPASHSLPKRSVLRCKLNLHARKRVLKRKRKGRGRLILVVVVVVGSPYLVVVVVLSVVVVVWSRHI